MRISKKATNVQLSEAIEDYLEKHLISHLERFVDKSDESASLSIEVGRTTRHHHKGDIFRAEVNLHVAGRNLRAESERNDLYVAID